MVGSQGNKLANRRSYYTATIINLCPALFYKGVAIVLTSITRATLHLCVAHSL